MEQEERDLIRRARRGDADAFRDLVDRSERQVYSLCLRMLSHREDAMDATQETYIKAWRYLKSFRGNAAFSTWLYRIATNVCIDALRRRRGALISVEQMNEAGRDVAEPEDFSDRLLSAQVISRGLAQLPAHQRAVIVLRDIHGLSYEQIAHVLRCPTGTVRSRLSRARDHLAQILDNGNKNMADASKKVKGGEIQ